MPRFWLRNTENRILDENAGSMLAKVDEAARRMDSLIRALLSYTRLTYERFPLGPLNLESAVREVVRQLLELGWGKGIRLQVEPMPFDVLGHMGLLSEAVRQLLENAFKYSRRLRSPAVVVRAEGRGDRVRLLVEDDGPGVAPEYRARIFELFELLSPSEASSGVGVGLPVVRKAVERMDGHVGIESEEGVGSRFWIELRKAP